MTAGTTLTPEAASRPIRIGAVLSHHAKRTSLRDVEPIRGHPQRHHHSYEDAREGSDRLGAEVSSIDMNILATAVALWATAAGRGARFQRLSRAGRVKGPSRGPRSRAHGHGVSVVFRACVRAVRQCGITVIQNGSVAEPM